MTARMHTKMIFLLVGIVVTLVVLCQIYQFERDVSLMADPCQRAMSQGVYIPECATRK